MGVPKLSHSFDGRKETSKPGVRKKLEWDGRLSSFLLRSWSLMSSLRRPKGGESEIPE